MPSSPRGDVQVGIEEIANRVASITYLKGAGSFADKTSRLVETARGLGGDEHALQTFAKADQAGARPRVSELKATSGDEAAGQPTRSCAIDEQYLPDSSGADPEDCCRTRARRGRQADHP
jgi:hypothetical protein